MDWFVVGQTEKYVLDKTEDAWGEMRIIYNSTDTKFCKQNESKTNSHLPAPWIIVFKLLCPDVQDYGRKAAFRL